MENLREILDFPERGQNPGILLNFKRYLKSPEKISGNSEMRFGYNFSNVA